LAAKWSPLMVNARGANAGLPPGSDPMPQAAAAWAVACSGCCAGGDDWGAAGLLYNSIEPD
jgi:hypothetical protein